MDIDESRLPLTSYRERIARGNVVFSIYITILFWDPKSDRPGKMPPATVKLCTKMSVYCVSEEVLCSGSEIWLKIDDNYEGLQMQIDYI